MTNGVACPEPLLLSQLLDHELEAAEECRITEHLKHCSDCRERVARMQQTNEVVRAQLFSEGRRLCLLSEPSSSCPPLENIVAYMQGAATANEDQQIEQHIQDCEACFREAKEAARVMVFLASPQTPPVPASLQARVAKQWEPAAPLSLPRLVLQLTEQGLRLIESYLTPPLLSVKEVLVPGLAYRAGYRGSVLSLRLQAGENEIAVFAVPEKDRVAVTLTLLNQEKKALANRRIFIRQLGKVIFSAQTDQDGKLDVPWLEPGSYEVACDEIHTTFQLEMRPQSLEEE